MLTVGALAVIRYAERHGTKRPWIIKLLARRLAAMGIRDHPIAPRSPWQNGHAERLIGSIRRECLDHVVVFGEARLRRILANFAGYYNELRTHLSLAKDSPRHRPVQRFGCSAYLWRTAP